MPPDFVTAASQLFMMGYHLYQREGRENTYILVKAGDRFRYSADHQKRIEAKSFEEAALKAWELVNKGNDNG